MPIEAGCKDRQPNAIEVLNKGFWAPGLGEPGLGEYYLGFRIWRLQGLSFGFKGFDFQICGVEPVGYRDLGLRICVLRI